MNGRRAGLPGESSPESGAGRNRRESGHVADIKRLVVADDPLHNRHARS